MWQTLGIQQSWLFVAAVIVAAMLIIALSAVIGAIVLRPLNQRAGRLRAPTRFQLSDFFWLLVQLQVSLAYAVRSVGFSQTNYFWLVLGFLVMATVGMWSGAVSFMSRAGVTDPRRRAVFILLLLPLTLTLMICSSLLFVVCPAGLLLDRIAGFGMLSVYLGISTIGHWGPVGIALMAASLGVAGYLLRRTACWILATDDVGGIRRDGGITSAESTSLPLSGA